MPRNAQSTAARGYGAAHQRERKRWEPIVKAGRASCWRCGRPIPPKGPWDLGHDDWDRTIYRGPECRPCNRGAGARKANLSRRKPPRTVTTLRW